MEVAVIKVFKLPSDEGCAFLKQHKTRRGDADSLIGLSLPYLIPVTSVKELQNGHNMI